MAQTQQATQQSQLDIDTQKAMIPIAASEDQLTVDQKRAQLEADKAESAQVVEEASVWNAWAKDYPAEAVAQMQEQGHLPSDEGVPAPGYGSAPDDGSQTMGPTPQEDDGSFDDGSTDEDVFDGEAPLMFEEKYANAADDGEEPSRTWPHDDDQANMLGDIDRMLGDGPDELDERRQHWGD